MNLEECCAYFDRKTTYYEPMVCEDTMLTSIFDKKATLAFATTFLGAFNQSTTPYLLGAVFNSASERCEVSWTRR